MGLNTKAFSKVSTNKVNCVKENSTTFRMTGDGSTTTWYTPFIDTTNMSEELMIIINPYAQIFTGLASDIGEVDISMFGSADKINEVALSTSIVANAKFQDGLSTQNMCYANLSWSSTSSTLAKLPYIRWKIVVTNDGGGAQALASGESLHMKYLEYSTYQGIEA